MPAAKRQKLASGRQRSASLKTKQTTTRPSQRNIQAFGRVSKTRNVAAQDAKKLDVERKPSVVGVGLPLTASTQKRKRASTDTDGLEERVATSAKRHHAAGAMGGEEDATALGSAPSRSTRRSRGLPPSPDAPAATPTRGAARMLERLSLKPASKLVLTSSDSAPSSSYETPLTSPCSSGGAPQEDSRWLPVELEDLIQLHSSFLTALSLHFAHHGTASPVDVRMLTPSIAKTWGKRKVVLEDIKRSLGMIRAAKGKSSTAQLLTLVDYGQGKICLELNERAGKKRKRGVIAEHIDEDGLNRLFVQELERAWEDRTARKADVAAFIKALPLADVAISTTSTRSTLLAKGQRRLDELKAAAAPAKTAKPAQPSTSQGEQQAPTPRKEAPDSPTSPPATATNRGQSLLDRILAKQQALSSLPAGPTKAELERRAALHRAEEVLAIIALLAASKGGGMRASFSMSMLVQSLQGSVRSPIGKEEAVRCVEVLASEVTPEYVGIVRTGSVVAVVVNLAMKPGLSVVRGRLRAAGVE